MKDFARIIRNVTPGDLAGLGCVVLLALFAAVI